MTNSKKMHWTPYCLVHSKLMYCDQQGRRYIVHPGRKLRLGPGFQLDHQVITLHVAKKTDENGNKLHLVKVQCGSGRYVQLSEQMSYSDVKLALKGEQLLAKSSSRATVDLHSSGGSGLHGTAVRGWPGHAEHCPVTTQDLLDLFTGLGSMIPGTSVEGFFWRQVKDLEHTKCGEFGVSYYYADKTATGIRVELPDFIYLSMEDHAQQPGTSWAVPTISSLLEAMKWYPRIMVRQEGYLWDPVTGDPRWHDKLQTDFQDYLEHDAQNRQVSQRSPAGFLLKRSAEAALCPRYNWVDTKNVMDLDLKALRIAKDLVS